jgi:hypothetical protein
MMKQRIYMLTLILCCSSIAIAQTRDKNGDLGKFLGKNGYVAVQMQKLITGHLYVEATLNGVKGRFILDTGAGATVIETTRKDKFKMTAVESKDKATGAGSTGMMVQESGKNKISLGNYTYNNDTLRLMSLDHVNQALKSLGIEEMDGVIGADILTAGDAVIDYTKMVLYLKD